MKVMSQCVAKSAYHSIRQRKVVPLSVYAKSLVTGLRDGARFDVDRDRRLYVENARARFNVSEANAVAGAVPRR